MELLLLEIPDQNDELAKWLEQQLIGFHLYDLYRQLFTLWNTPVAPVKAIDSGLPIDSGFPIDSVFPDLDLTTFAPSQDSRIEHWSDSTWRDVQQLGLKTLAPSQLRSLLAYPEDLLTLQERLISDDAVYWERLFAANDPPKPQNELPNSLARSTVTVRRPYATSTVTVDDFTTVEVRSQENSWQRAFAWYIGAGVAFTLVALLIQQPFHRAESELAITWGWNQPGVLDTSHSPSLYLNRLADAAEEWTRTNRSSAESLANRLKELDQACERLLVAEHQTLANEDRDWLIERCTAWRQKVNEYQQQLQADHSDFDSIRAAADQTIEKLSQALRQRAELIRERV